MRTNIFHGKKAAKWNFFLSQKEKRLQKRSWRACRSTADRFITKARFAPLMRFFGKFNMGGSLSLRGWYADRTTDFPAILFRPQCFLQKNRRKAKNEDHYKLGGTKISFLGSSHPVGATMEKLPKDIYFRKEPRNGANRFKNRKRSFCWLCVMHVPNTQAVELPKLVCFFCNFSFK